MKISIIFIPCYNDHLSLCSFSVVHNELQQQHHRSNGDGTLSPTSNQLARWFSPELLAQGTIRTTALFPFQEKQILPKSCCNSMKMYFL